MATCIRRFRNIRSLLVLRTSKLEHPSKNFKHFLPRFRFSECKSFQHAVHSTSLWPTKLLVACQRTNKDHGLSLQANLQSLFGTLDCNRIYRLPYRLQSVIWWGDRVLCSHRRTGSMMTAPFTTIQCELQSSLASNLVMSLLILHFLVPHAAQVAVPHWKFRSSARSSNLEPLRYPLSLRCLGFFTLFDRLFCFFHQLRPLNGYPFGTQH